MPLCSPGPLAHRAVRLVDRLDQGLTFRASLAGSLTPEKGIGAATFARSGAAPYINSGLALASAATDVARFDWRSGETRPGLLIEPAGTNNLPRSQEADNAAWSKTAVTVTADATAAPDGTTTADKVAEDNTSNNHRIFEGFTLASGGTYTASIFMKAAERSWAAMIYKDRGGVNQGSYFDLANGVLGTVFGTPLDRGMVALANGWYWCYVVLAATAGATTSNNMQVFAALANGNNAYTGTTGSGIYVWGADLKADAFLSSYIATAAAAVNRNADTLTYPTANHITPQGGVVSLWVHVQSALAATVDRYLFDTGSSDTQDRIALYVPSGTLTPKALMYGHTDGASQAITSSVSLVAGWNHVVLAYGANGPYLLMLNGVGTSTIVSSGSWSDLSAVPASFGLGQSRSAAGQWGGRVRDVRLYGPERASGGGALGLELYRRNS